MLHRNSALRAVSSLIAVTLLAACAVVPPPAPPPPPAPLPEPPAPPPPPPPVVSVPAEPWDIAPVATGDWSYGREGADSLARFGLPGQRPMFVLRCEGPTRRIGVMRADAAPTGQVMRIRTSHGVVEWPAQADANVRGALSAMRPAGDPGLDWIAFSRGRISVEVDGTARLILPIWAELQRVIEDCRG